MYSVSWLSVSIRTPSKILSTLCEATIQKLVFIVDVQTETGHLIGQLDERHVETVESASCLQTSESRILGARFGPASGRLAASSARAP